MMSRDTVRATASFSRSWIKISEAALITDGRKFVISNSLATSKTMSTRQKKSI